MLRNNLRLRVSVFEHRSSRICKVYCMFYVEMKRFAFEQISPSLLNNFGSFCVSWHSQSTKKKKIGTQNSIFHFYATRKWMSVECTKTFKTNSVTKACQMLFFVDSRNVMMEQALSYSYPIQKWFSQNSK